MKHNNSKKVRVEPTRRPKKNPLKARGIEAVDYKDIETLRTFISERGKIRSRRVTGAARPRRRAWAPVGCRGFLGVGSGFGSGRGLGS